MKAVLFHDAATAKTGPQPHTRTDQVSAISSLRPQPPERKPPPRAPSFGAESVNQSLGLLLSDTAISLSATGQDTPNGQQSASKRRSSHSSDSEYASSENEYRVKSAGFNSPANSKLRKIPIGNSRQVTFVPPSTFSSDTVPVVSVVTPTYDLDLSTHASAFKPPSASF